MVDVPIPDPTSAFSDTAFRGRVYGVTGSAHGIGESTVKQLVRLGASVVVMDIDPKNLNRVEKDLSTTGASALVFRGDVADAKFLKDVIRTAHKRWGRIDGWVNNACYNPGWSADSLRPHLFERSWQVNVTAAWTACGLLVPIMKKQGGGTIVTLSSIMAHLPNSGNAAYALAKSALEGMTRSLAVDFGPDRIRFNAIVPGHINTHYSLEKYDPPRGVPAAVFEKSRRLRERMRNHMSQIAQPWPVRGEARDVADVILFLLSDAAQFVTGACIPVDGGCGVYRPYLWQLEMKKILRDYQTHRRLMKKYPNLKMKRLLRAQKNRLRGRK